MPDLHLVVAWLGAIGGAYVLLFWVAAWWARRTPNDIDDVVVGVLQRPVLLGLCLWAAISLVGHSDLPPTVRATVQQAAHLLLIAVVTWGVWRLVRDTVLYYGRELARRTESSFDDVLVPVLDVLAPVVIVGTGAILMLRLLGADVSTVMLTAGGAAVVVGLALKDTLGNILGGLTLLVDTPFRFGDLVVLDGVVCQIVHIGLRVTTLYNTEEHADIYLPNSSLAAAKLINITRPSPDLRVPIDLTVGAGIRLEEARAALQELADANPYVLGQVPRKLEAMRRALGRLDPKSAQARELRWGLAALRREREVDRHLAAIGRLLGEMLATIRAAERKGLSGQEVAAIREELARLDSYDDRLQAAMRRWAQARTRDPHLVPYPEDRLRLLQDVEGRLQAYEGRLGHLRRHLKTPDLYTAQRLDDLVVGFRDWLPRMFKLVTPAWKCPFVGVVQTGPGGASLRLYVYVDDIHLERFVRRLRVVTALRDEATARLPELAARA